ncbi:MAG: HAD-IC family P-type ATPase [Christensenellales bacterium]
MVAENSETRIAEDISERGLTSAEVAERVKEGKVNGEQTIRTKSVGRIIFDNTFTFFNFIFFVMAVILAFFASFDKDGIGNYGFVILCVFNTLVGIIQELRAKHTMDKLSLISAPKVIVLRDGTESEIKVRDIVLDDVMILSAGQQICADSVVTDGSIEVNESLITGEPDAIRKNAGDKLMSGSFVVSGRAKARVEHVGMDNFAMKISAGAKYIKKPVSVIRNSLNKIVKTMSVIIVPLGIALFCVKYLVQGNGLDDTVITTIGSLVGMIPSGLVMLSSAVFCLSVIRIAKHHTLAQDMYCVETLARVDVLCLDKTGTITEGSMEIQGIKTVDVSEDEFKVHLKSLMNALPDDNATATAVRNYVEEVCAGDEAESTVPFSSVRKWSAARINGVTYVMGAPEFVFPDESDEMVAITREKAEEGLRVIVFASTACNLEGDTLPDNLKPEGFIFIADKIRKEAPDTLRFFREQGVNVKIISGDNPVTVRAVAKRAGLDDCDNIIDMSTLKTDEEVMEAADKYTVFGRVLPDQKLLLVKALKAKGHTVAMTGDGVNDVLALKEADCSVAMASGSDAAKNVSSLVLLDSNFASMPKVVAEGRRSINNLERSASLFLVKTGYNLLIALLFLIVPSVLPFEPRQLTLLGGVTIGIPSTILALEKNNKRVEGRFLPKVIMKAVPGIITVMTGIIAIVIVTQCIFTGLSQEEQQSLYFLATVFAGYLFVFKSCCPFNILHAAVFVFVILLLVLCYFVNLSFIDIQAFFGLYRNMTPDMWKAIAVVWAILIPVFAVSWWLDSRYNETFQDKVGALGDRIESLRKSKKRKNAQA